MHGDVVGDLVVAMDQVEARLGLLPAPGAGEAVADPARELALRLQRGPARRRAARRAAAPSTWPSAASGTLISLPKISAGRLGHADVVVERLAHLPHPVGPGQDRHASSPTCGRCPNDAWTSRPNSRLNFCSVPPSSTSARDRDRVVALQHRVEQLEQRDRLRRGHPVGEVVALEQAGDREAAGEGEQLRARHVEPLAVEPDLGAARGSSTLKACSWNVRAFASISLGAEHRALVGAAARVADPAGVVADDHHRDVPGRLELAELLEHDHVAEVDVGGGRVDAELDPQRLRAASSRRDSSPSGSTSTVPSARLASAALKTPSDPDPASR